MLGHSVISSSLRLSFKWFKMLVLNCIVSQKWHAAKVPAANIKSSNFVAPTNQRFYMFVCQFFISCKTHFFYTWSQSSQIWFKAFWSSFKYSKLISCNFVHCITITWTDFVDSQSNIHILSVRNVCPFCEQNFCNAVFDNFEFKHQFLQRAAWK